MSIYAYIRVSAVDMNYNRQIDAVNDYCKEKKINNITIFKEKKSGKDLDREEYLKLKTIIKPGDELIIKEMDRLSRNKDDIKKEIQFFKDNNIKLRILNLPTTLQDFPTGQEFIGEMINNILIEVLSTIAQEERLKIKQRQMEGIKALKERNGGKGIGRPKRKIPNSFKKNYDLWLDKKITAVEFARLIGVSRNTLYLYIKEYNKYGKDFLS